MGSCQSAGTDATGATIVGDIYLSVRILCVLCAVQAAVSPPISVRRAPSARLRGNTGFTRFGCLVRLAFLSVIAGLAA